MCSYCSFLWILHLRPIVKRSIMQLKCLVDGISAEGQFFLEFAFHYSNWLALLDVHETFSVLFFFYIDSSIRNFQYKPISFFENFGTHVTRFCTFSTWLFCAVVYVRGRKKQWHFEIDETRVTRSSVNSNWTKPRDVFLSFSSVVFCKPGHF